MKKLIAASEKAGNFAGYRTAAMLKLTYFCGLRVSEMVGLPERCINFAKKQIVVMGKGSKERIVPIADKAIEAVEQYLSRRRFYLKKRQSRWLFPSNSAKGHITRDAFFKSLHNIALKAGLPADKISPHVMRHSFATHLLNHDVDLRSVQKMLGHEDIATTEIYTHIIPAQLREEVRQNHPLAKQGLNYKKKL